ncbi:unnamed protein product [Blepharisma stoltei]|uniref:Uncharacterized protein n=1 Tax=Blepharisma stoltei TaxID=1481888 RepID=A0AAU9JS63_9CILI|nr:unnamed protein product [Blepharisma stoltei]
MGSCISHKKHYRAIGAKIATELSDHERQWIKMQREAVFRKKISLAPILKLEYNELLARRRGQLFQTKTNSTISEISEELFKGDTMCPSTHQSP